MKTINLKLYGLPRSYTNLLAYVVMSTYPEIKVWHSNCPAEPRGEKYWKHGQMIEVPSIDGYILCAKNRELWKISMMNYPRTSNLKLDSVWWDFVHSGWQRDAEYFQLITDSKGIQSFTFFGGNPANLYYYMENFLEEIAEAYLLPLREFELPTFCLARNGDNTPLRDYLTITPFKKT